MFPGGVLVLPGFDLDTASGLIVLELCDLRLREGVTVKDSVKVLSVGFEGGLAV